jgi:hypothetical protein
MGPAWFLISPELVEFFIGAAIAVCVLLSEGKEIPELMTAA